jgi:hypothetical protein
LPAGFPFAFSAAASGSAFDVRELLRFDFAFDFYTSTFTFARVVSHRVPRARRIRRARLAFKRAVRAFARARSDATRSRSSSSSRVKTTRLE